MRCAALRCDALRCAALRCDAMRCAAMRCDAMRCDALRCDARCCGARASTFDADADPRVPQGTPGHSRVLQGTSGPPIERDVVHCAQARRGRAADPHGRRQVLRAHREPVRAGTAATRPWPLIRSDSHLLRRSGRMGFLMCRRGDARVFVRVRVEARAHARATGWGPVCARVWQGCVCVCAWGVEGVVRMRASTRADPLLNGGPR